MSLISVFQGVDHDLKWAVDLFAADISVREDAIISVREDAIIFSDSGFGMFY